MSPAKCAPAEQTSPGWTQTLKNLSEKETYIHQDEKDQLPTNSHQIHKTDSTHPTLRDNYWKHVNTVTGSMTQTVDPANQKVNTKKLYSFMKHLQKNQQRVAQLKEHGITYSENLDKATILNRQFKSIFTP